MDKEKIHVEMINSPGGDDWLGVYHRALLTIGKDAGKEPSLEWKKKILKARHSPIRYLKFSFELSYIPYWVACELRTHVHDMPYVADFGVYIKSSRNDRQKDFDRNAARQDAPVNMILDMNAEQLMVLANKRLCMKATEEARAIVQMIKEKVLKSYPEFEGLLVPMCQYHGAVCHEFQPCYLESKGIK